MSKKNIRLENSQETILETVNLVADAVTETMGPGGRNVLTTTPGGAPVVTKDGVTVANSIELEDEEKELICKVVKEAANRTNKAAGDGTTTSIALTRALFSEGHKFVKAGHNVTQIKREIDKGRRKVTEELDKFTKTIDATDKEELYAKLLDIATISMNGETDIAELVARAITDAGKYGIVNVIENDRDENVLEKESGIKLNQGWVSPFFSTDRSDKTIVLENCHILITSHQLTSAAQLAAIEEAIKPLIKTSEPLLIIPSKAEGEFLSLMVTNNKQGRLKNCIIRPPYFGNIRKEFYTDLALFTGATVIEAEQGQSLELVQSKHLGFAKRVEITEDSTVMIGGKGDDTKLQSRIHDLRVEMDEMLSKDLNKVEERLAKLSGGVVLIKLAKQAHIEMEERKHRIEDAVNACKAALEDGIVPGGGAALVKASRVLDDTILGEKILKKACVAPMMKICENAGFSGDVGVYITSSETNDDETVNALTRKRVDAFKEGIIDPVKVTKNALTNAVSIAGVLLTTDVVISDIKVDTPVNPYPMY